MAEGLHIISSLPEAELFRFPPVGAPAPIPPPSRALSLMNPFNIPDSIFAGALDARVPITIAATYAITVKFLNRYNRANGKKPWSISKTRPFAVFVVFHNIFLAVYSAWTFWGMLGGMRRSILSPFAPTGLAGTVDSFCRLHGNQGLGQSTWYNESAGMWMSAVESSSLVNGQPSSLPTGRLWNEGLAYYGWIFYLSKFYEVLDTFIILAKGKPSSTLQTYHHAGAMMCMWAGMRYMSAPIWMFVLYNSFIHALMYTYYTITAFSIKVPMALKRTLTTMQITQFIVGASYAMTHSFISYVAPISVSQSSLATVSTDSGALGSLKQLFFGNDAAAAAVSGDFTTQYIVQPCIASSSETFAIWLNVLYLAPLTYLFVSFFISSYVKRSNAAQKLGKAAARRLSNVTLAEKAGWDAARNLEREVYGPDGAVRNGGSDSSAISDEDAVTPKKANGKANGKAKRRA